MKRFCSAYWFTALCYAIILMLWSPSRWHIISIGECNAQVAADDDAEDASKHYNIESNMQHTHNFPAEDAVQKESATANPQLQALISTACDVVDFLQVHFHNPSDSKVDPAEELDLDAAMAGMDDSKVYERLYHCFVLVSHHLAKYGRDYYDVIAARAPQKGMRTEDFTRVVVHGSWITCYYNLQEEDIKKFKSQTATLSDEFRILSRTASTPIRFSRRQLDNLEKMIQDLREKEPKNFDTVIGWNTAYAVLILLFVPVIIYVAHRQYHISTSGKPIPKKEEKHKSKHKKLR